MCICTASTPIGSEKQHKLPYNFQIKQNLPQIANRGCEPFYCLKNIPKLVSQLTVTISETESNFIRTRFFNARVSAQFNSE